MTLGEHVFLYCERGTNEALLAEPINAISNVAFLLAALIGLQLVLWRPPEERSPDHFLLPVLVLFIGLGSLAFHLYADQVTALADVVPITVFMLVYLGFALNRFLGVPPAWTVLVVIGFAAMVAITMQVQCSAGAIGLLGPDVQGAKPCLNGSLFYLPALVALIVVGLLAEERDHRAAPYLLWAAAILAVSITLRSLDIALCDKVVIEGRKVGTHFAWHVLNALALFLLLRASLEGGLAAVTRAAIAPPLDETSDAQGETPAENLPAEDVPAPKKLAERIAPASEEAAKEDEAPEEEEERKTFFPA
ncbi:MAG: ceramidase domain-containing protein [Methyloceanibacter sp.]